MWRFFWINSKGLCMLKCSDTEYLNKRKKCLHKIDSNAVVHVSNCIGMWRDILMCILSCNPSHSHAHVCILLCNFRCDPESTACTCMSCIHCSLYSWNMVRYIEEREVNWQTALSAVTTRCTNYLLMYCFIDHVVREVPQNRPTILF